MEKVKLKKRNNYYKIKVVGKMGPKMKENK